MTRRCYPVSGTLPNGEKFTARVQTTGRPPSKKDLEALRGIIAAIHSCDSCHGTGYGNMETRTGYCSCGMGTTRMQNDH